MKFSQVCNGGTIPLQRDYRKVIKILNKKQKKNWGWQFLLDIYFVLFTYLPSQCISANVQQALFQSTLPCFLAYGLLSFVLGFNPTHTSDQHKSEGRCYLTDSDSAFFSLNSCQLFFIQIQGLNLLIITFVCHNGLLFRKLCVLTTVVSQFICELFLVSLKKCQNCFYAYTCVLLFFS